MKTVLNLATLVVFILGFLGGVFATSLWPPLPEFLHGQFARFTDWQEARHQEEIQRAVEQRLTDMDKQ